MIPSNSKIENTRNDREPLRIMVATEYLPPYISGIANRCKNLINGYRKHGHSVSVYSCKGTDCDYVVPSLPNPFYNQQRMFILPPLGLVLDLINPFKTVPYDICHVFAPLCLGFLPILPLLWIRNIKIYVSYHVYLEYYRDYYFGHTSILSKIFKFVSDIMYPLLYFWPLTAFAECVGVPSSNMDSYVKTCGKKVHILKSGLDTTIFHPSASKLKLELTDDDNEAPVNIKDLVKTNGPILLYCGRLAMEKNASFLIEALANPLLKDASLVIVGDGPIRQELEQLAVDVVGADCVYSVIYSNIRRAQSHLEEMVVFEFYSLE